MSVCSFTVGFSGLPEEVFQKARTAIHDQGGQLLGDESAGDFELIVFGSSLRGSYQISEQELHVTIDAKPSMIPCSTIQSYLAKHLEAVGARA